MSGDGPPLPRRRRIRLSAAAYRQDGRLFSATVCTRRNQSVFSDIAFGHDCVAALRALCARRRVPVFIYCLMPDHAHLLVGVHDLAPLPLVIGQWKSLCYRRRRELGYSKTFWQRSFWDHALRRDEEIERTARYILQNPVRAGLVDQAIDYPLSGSPMLDLGPDWP